MGGVDALTAPGGRPATALRPLRVRPIAALALGGLTLVLTVADLPLARLAHQPMTASGGSVPVWFSAAFGVVGLAVAWRKPGNPLGWTFLAMAIFGTLSQDASFYNVADYRLNHGKLPLGWLALVAQPGWAPTIVLFGLAVLLFPDGRPRSPRWRWIVWVYLALGLLWTAGALGTTVDAMAIHQVQVDAGGNLAGPAASPTWWITVQEAFLLLLGACWLSSLAAQVISWRRSSGVRRQQLKWLASGIAVVVVTVGLAFTGALTGTHGARGVISGVAADAAYLALPVTMGVAILRYRLFDIDRIVSRAVAYSVVTGLLACVYAGMVLLATRVVSVRSPVVVAAATLVAAALFNPLRRRVQRLTDRRFNRASYDAEKTVALFAARLKDAVNLDSVRDDLADVVHQVLEPELVSVWLRPPG